MLINKIPCLDKGYVALISSMNSSDKLKRLSLEFLRTADTSSLLDMAHITMAIKCPIFVQLNLSKYNLQIVNALVVDSDVEAYIPNVGEIGGKDRETNTLISDDIQRTTEALLINPRAYQSDGCDRFMSQLLTPINVYTTIIVCGRYKDFDKFCAQNNAPGPIKSYISAIKSILDVEWK